jgi:hypothetical protein
MFPSLGVRAGSLGLGVLLLATPCMGQTSQPETIEGFLAENVGLSTKEISKLGQKPVVKEIPVQETKREFAVFAGVRIDAPREAVLEALKNPENLKHPDTLIQFGKFGDPPTVEDIADYRLAGDDLEKLAACVPGKCKLKVNREFLETVPDVDWAAEDAIDGLTAQFREGVVTYVNDYLERGADALIVYGDKPEPQSVAEGFEKILGRESYMYDYVPELTEYLKAFPSGSLDNVYDRMYWAVEDYGLNPVTLIVHLTVHEAGEGMEKIVVITQKQIYTNRYFHARVETISLEPDPEGKGTYVFYADRALFDDDLPGMVRGLLGSDVKKSARRWLISLKSLVEGS